MKVLHVIPTLLPGGAQNIALGLVEAAREKGIDASILCLFAPPDAGDQVAAGSVNVFYLNYPFPRNFRNVKRFILAQRSLRSFLHKHRPDVIHSHLFLSKVVLCFSRTARSIPIVDTVHDNMPWWQRTSLKQILMSELDKYFARSIAHTSVAISHSVQSELQELTMLTKERVPIIYNFIADRFFDVEPADVTANGLHVLVVCRTVIEKKGLDLVIEIAQHLVKVFPSFRLTIIGDGPDAKRLARMIDYSGLQGVVMQPGHIADPRPFYRSARFLLMPSRWEGFGLSAAEAGAMGLPVIASDVGGLAEVVIHGETGLLLPPASLSRFVDAVSQLLYDGELCKRMSQNARSSALLRFRVDRVITAYIQIYMAATGKDA